MVTLNRPGAAFRPGHLFPKGECDHVPPLHFADQPRVTGNVDPELLRSPLCRERTLTAGLSPLKLPTQQSYMGTWCHWHHCSSRLLGQSAYTIHISFCEWLRVWPRSILRNELDDSGHRGSSVGSQGRVLSSETRVSTVRRAFFGTSQLKQYPPPSKDALGCLVVQVRVERFSFRELRSSALGHSLRNCRSLALRCYRI